MSRDSRRQTIPAIRLKNIVQRLYQALKNDNDINRLGRDEASTEDGLRVGGRRGASSEGGEASTDTDVSISEQDLALMGLQVR